MGTMDPRSALKDAAPSANVAGHGPGPWLGPWLGLAAVFLALVAALAGIGGPHDAIEGLAVVLHHLVVAGWPVLVYLASAAGYGVLAQRAVRGSRVVAGSPAAPRRASSDLSLGFALGLGLLLTLTQIVGVLGLLTRAGAWMVIAPGLFAAAWALRAALATPTSRQPGRPSLAMTLSLPATAVLLVAACNPPGWLWASEARNYDSLSYHLQLAQEWIAAGRVWPVEHNVYSFLPSFMEAAFVHVGVLGGATGPQPALAGAAPRPWGLLAGEGMGAISTQLLHAAIGLLMAWTVACLARAALSSAGADTDATRTRALSGLAGAVALSVPWTIVVGSLSYNEMGMMLFAAAAMIAALDSTRSPTLRGVFAAVLVGFACGCKPTAILFAGLPVGVLLLGTMPARDAVRAVAAGSVAGLLTLLPWLLRNHVASGNAVFPFATNVLGLGHWTPEQAQRYASAHHFSGSTLDRVRLMFLPDPSDPAGVRHRGLMHAQWSVFFPVAAGAIAACLWPRRDGGPRRIPALLAAGLLLQLLAWLFATHMQSRFLLPLLVPGSVLVALALARLAHSRPRVATAAGAIVVAALAGSSARQFWLEPVVPVAHRPNALLAGGPGERTGESIRPLLARASPQERGEFAQELGPEVFCNLLLPPGRLLLVGDATPFYFSRPTLYATTWDTSVMGTLMRRAPGDGAAWTRELAAMDVRFALINFSELDRLRRSGWLDPAIDPASLEPWIRGHTRVVRSWDRLGVVLVELAPTAQPVP